MQAAPEAVFQDTSNHITNSTPSIKLTLIGEGGVGKDMFLKHYTEKLFESEKLTNPKTGVKVYAITFYFNRGPIVFKVWDMNARENRDICYLQAQCAILMYDVTNLTTRSMHYSDWLRNLKHCSVESMPIALVGNTAKVKRGEPIRVPPNDERREYFEISVNSKDDCDKVFLWLAQQLSGDSKLHFVEEPHSHNQETRSPQD